MLCPARRKVREFGFQETVAMWGKKGSWEFGGPEPTHPGVLESCVTYLVLDGGWGNSTPCAVVARVTESRWLSQPL